MRRARRRPGPRRLVPGPGRDRRPDGRALGRAAAALGLVPRLDPPAARLGPLRRGRARLRPDAERPAGGPARLDPGRRPRPALRHRPGPRPRLGLREHADSRRGTTCSACGRRRPRCSSSTAALGGLPPRHPAALRREHQAAVPVLKQVPRRGGARARAAQHGPGVRDARRDAQRPRRGAPAGAAHHRRARPQRVGMLRGRADGHRTTALSDRYAQPPAYHALTAGFLARAIDLAGGARTGRPARRSGSRSARSGPTSRPTATSRTWAAARASRGRSPSPCSRPSTRRAAAATTRRRTSSPSATAPCGASARFTPSGRTGWRSCPPRTAPPRSRRSTTTPATSSTTASR